MAVEASVPPVEVCKKLAAPLVTLEELLGAMKIRRS
jgi:hypothetical protein